MKNTARIFSLALIISLINPSIQAASWKSKALAGSKIGLGSISMLAGLLSGIATCENYALLQDLKKEIKNKKITAASREECKKDIVRVKKIIIVNSLCTLGFLTLGTWSIISGIKNLRHIFQQKKINNTHQT